MPTRTAPRCLLAVAVLATLLSVASLATPAAADGYNIGVSYVDYSDAPDQCLPANARPCTPGAGAGQSHQVTVTQSAAGGQLSFDGIATTSQWEDHIWIGAELGAGCKTGFKLFHAEFHDGAVADDGLWWDEGEVGEWSQDISVPFAKTMPVKRVALDLPIGDDMADELFAAGEAVISARIAGGMTEGEARSIPFQQIRPQQLTAEVVCRGNVGLHVKYVKSATLVVPITVTYQGVPQAPAPPPAPPAGTRRPTGQGLRAAPEVTDATLAVIADPDDPCRLHLSGSISANASMTVEYRFVDPTGRRTRIYEVAVDQTGVAFVDVEAAVPASPDGPVGLASPGVHGTVGGYTAVVDESQYSGTYELEVVAPNHVLAADGFQVPYC